MSIEEQSLTKEELELIAARREEKRKEEEAKRAREETRAKELAARQAKLQAEQKALLLKAEQTVSAICAEVVALNKGVSVNLKNSKGSGWYFELKKDAHEARVFVQFSVEHIRSSSWSRHSINTGRYEVTVQKTSWGQGERDVTFPQLKGVELKFNYKGIAARIVERLEEAIARDERRDQQRLREKTNRQLVDELRTEFEINYSSRRNVSPSRYTTGYVKVSFEANVTEEEARKILQGLAQFEKPKT